MQHDEVFDLQTLESWVAVPRTTLFSELTVLHKLGVLQRLENDGRVFYQQVQSPFWDWCRELLSRAPRNDASA